MEVGMAHACRRRADQHLMRFRLVDLDVLDLEGLPDFAQHRSLHIDVPFFLADETIGGQSWRSQGQPGAPPRTARIIGLVVPPALTPARASVARRRRSRSL